MLASLRLFSTFGFIHVAFQLSELAEAQFEHECLTDMISHTFTHKKYCFLFLTKAARMTLLSLQQVSYLDPAHNGPLASICAACFLIQERSNSKAK